MNTELIKRMLEKAEGKRLSVDIDNSIALTNLELKKLGYDISIYPNPKLMSKEFWLGPIACDAMYNAKVDTNVLSVIKKLKEFGADIVFATQRDAALKNLTYRWFNKEPELSSLLDKPIMFVKDKLESNGDIYIEDDPVQIQKLTDTKKVVFVPKWDYNNNMKNKYIITIDKESSKEGSLKEVDVTWLRKNLIF